MAFMAQDAGRSVPGRLYGSPPGQLLRKRARAAEGRRPPDEECGRRLESSRQRAGGASYGGFAFRDPPDLFEGRTARPADVFIDRHGTPSSRPPGKGGTGFPQLPIPEQFSCRAFAPPRSAATARNTLEKEASAPDCPDCPPVNPDNVPIGALAALAALAAVAAVVLAAAPLREATEFGCIRGDLLGFRIRIPTPPGNLRARES